MAKVTITEGNIYPVDSTYAATDGSYELFRITDEGGKNKIGCFLNDRYKGQNIAKGDTVKIMKITQVQVGWRKAKKWNKETGKYDKEEWEKEVSLGVDAMKVNSGIDDLPEFTDADVPFDVNTPWDENELPL